MPPRFSLLGPRRLAFRTTPIVPQKRIAPPQNRSTSNDTSKRPAQSNEDLPPAGGNESRLPHVTEEQAELDRIMGEEPPEIEERGTPVQEILQRDKDAQEKAPNVLKQEGQKGSQGQSRSYSTSARRLATEATHIQPAHFQGTRAVGLDYPHAGIGHKFPLPDMQQWKVTDHLRRRYDPVVDQVTKMIMRDGKLSQAQKNMEKILDTLRTAPPPQSSSNLVSDGAIDTGKTVQQLIRREDLPLSPIQYLTSIVDSVAPLVKIKHVKGVVGGGASVPLPVPLRVKQRRRAALKWILDLAENNKDTFLADRVAKEFIKVANGTSAVWDKRAALHRTAMTARANVKARRMPRKMSII